MPSTVNPGFSRAIQTLLPELGVRLPDSLVAELGHYNADERLPMALQDELWQVIEVQATGLKQGKCIGLQIGESLQLASFDMLSFLLLASPTLLGAAEALVSYSNLIGEGGSFVRERTDRGWKLSYRAQFEHGRYVRLDAILAGIIQSARWLAGRDLQPLAVGFECAKDDCQLRRRLFGNAQFYFRTLTTFIELSNSDWQRPLSSGSEEIQQQMLRLAQQQLQKMRPQTMEDKVTTLLRQRPWLSRTQMATLLSISERHMNRKLAEQGKSFRAVADQVKMECALELLKERGATQGSLASYLGYSDGSAFAKAFKRWTGMGMRAYMTSRVK